MSDEHAIQVLDTPNVPDLASTPRSHDKWREQLYDTALTTTSLHQNFAQALLDDFTQHGPAAIEELREDSPANYLKLIASILPKTTHVNIDEHRPATGISADTERLRALRDLVETAAHAGRPDAIAHQPQHNVLGADAPSCEDGSVLPADQHSEQKGHVGPVDTGQS